MTKHPTKIHGAWLLKPKIFGDERGFFLESWTRKTFQDLDLDVDFVQDNHSRSTKNVLRGLHYQIGDAAQGKLVWVTSGAVFDVLVDLRRSSPTFGQWDGYTLDEKNHERLWVPPGCAHGFLVMSEISDFHYKVTSPYCPDLERALYWKDTTLSISWPIQDQSLAIVSHKDDCAAVFNECEKYT